MRFLSVCSGIEAASIAWKPLGWTCAGVSEIDPFPRAVLQQRFDAQPVDFEDHRYDPQSNILPMFGDFTQIEAHHVGPIDLLVGGTPCFPAGTMIATKRGHIPIEEVVVGDQVVTHQGRFRSVVRTGSKRAKTVTVTGQGHYGLETTRNHRFYAIKKRSQSTRSKGKAFAKRWVEGPNWVAADELKGHHWGCLANWPHIPMPPVTKIGRETAPVLHTADLLTLAGAYLGDGWVRMNERRGSVIFGLNDEKLVALRHVFDAYGRWSSSREGKAIRVQISSRPLARWLSENFGSGAAEKVVPLWALSHPDRNKIIEGYRITDGGDYPDGFQATTVSKHLALTMRMLSVSCGYASSVRFFERPKTCLIEGRIVNQRDTYTVSFSHSKRSSFEERGFRWQCVRSVIETGTERTVFDLEVEEDHSYVADGIAVHNCQSFSIAGLRGGMADDRGNLSLEYIRLARRTRARWVAWENVPGVFSSNSGEDFRCFLSGLAGWHVPMPKDGWKNAGIIPPGPVDGAYGLAWRVLDAQYFGVPQRRRRVFVVGYIGDWRRAAAVLLERGSLLRNPPPSREKRKAAPTIPSRSSGGGGLGTDFDCDGGLVQETAGMLSAASGRSRGAGTDPAILVPEIVGQAMSAKWSKGTAGPAGDEHHNLIPVAQAFKPSHFTRGKDGAPSGVVPLLSADADKGDQDPLVYSYAIQERAVSENLENGPQGKGYQAFTLEARNKTQAVAYDMRGRKGGSQFEGPHDTANIRAGSGGSSRSDVASAVSENQKGEVRLSEQSGALAGGGGKPGQGYQAAMIGNAVRRLTPTECARLQGFPDDHCKIEWRGKAAEECPDGPQYKAFGNSMAVPVMRWIGERIDQVEKIGTEA